MKKSLCAVLTAFCALNLLTGCVHTVNGEAQLGVPVKDTLENRFENISVDTAFKASTEVLQFNGTLNKQDTLNHTLEAKINTRTVFVRVDQPKPNITRVQTQVRTKSGGADIDLCHEVATQIAIRIALAPH